MAWDADITNDKIRIKKVTIKKVTMKINKIKSAK